MQNKNTATFIFPILLVLYEIALYLSNDAYLPALPQITLDFDTTVVFAQWTLTLWFLGSCCLQLFLGPISDRFGRRPVLLIGGVVFILSAIVCAITSQMSVLLVARFIQGATIPAMSIAGYATIHELFDQKKAIKTLAWMNSVTVLAPSFGPLLGGLLLYVVHWRWLFGLLAVWAIIGLALLWLLMPETLTKENSHPIELKRVLKQYKNILCNAEFLTQSVIFCCSFGAMIAWICASPFLVITKFHYSLIEYGVIQILIFGSFITGARLIHLLIQRMPLKNILLMAIILGLTGSILMVAFSIMQSAWLVPMIMTMMLIGFSGGLLFPVLSRLAVEACTEPMGSRMAVFFTLMSLFAVIASMLASLVGVHLFGFSCIILGFIVVSALLFWHQHHHYDVKQNLNL